MTKENIMSSNCYLASDSIITGIFTIVGTILGFILARLSDHLSEGKRIRKEFNGLVNSVAYNTITNFYSPKLYELRKFFLANEDYVKVAANAHFFEKWLLKLTEMDAIPAMRIEWNDLHHIEELHADLQRLKPPSILRGLWG
ncbi:MAG: hypothetical protein M1587_12260 [Thaumarchaeota archaeon]|nr:hypothetical protein [Nitrososphaerota archaeon]